MAEWKNRHLAIFAFFVVVFSTSGMFIFYGYVIRGGTNITLATPVVQFTKHDSTSPKLAPMRGHISNIAEMCQLPEVKRRIRGTSSTNMYYLFNNTKVCYCVVPKAASTSLLRSLLIAEYPEKARYYETLSGRSIHSQREKIRSRSTSRACSTGSEMSFFVTRNPYQRLFSAYIDKIFLEKFRGMAEQINTKIQPFTNISQNCDVTMVTFEQFLNYLILTDPTLIDPHFVPITYICNPCEHHFDLILKQENLHEKNHELLKYLNKDGTLSKEEPLSDYSGMDGVQRIASTFFSHTKKRCEFTMDRQDAIYRRLWDALKILGNIDDRLEFNRSWFGIPFKANANTLVKHLRENGIETLGRVQREHQRRKHLTKAYRSVNSRIIRQIQRMYKLDFMFGYDEEPPK